MPKKEIDSDAALLNQSLPDTKTCCLVVDKKACLVTCNVHLLKLLGYEHNDVSGKKFTDLVHKAAHIQEISYPYSFYHFERAAFLPIKIELVNADGKPVQVIFRSQLIKNNNAEVIGAVGFIDDLHKLTEKQQLRESIWETQETLYNIIENSGDAILISDTRGCISIVNDMLLDMLDYEREELIGKHIISLSPMKGTYTSTTGETVTIDEDYLQQQIETANKLFTERKVSCELYYIRRDAVILPVEATLSLVKDKSGEMIGAIIICRDCTERKRTEIERSQYLDTLNAAVQNKTRELNAINEQLYKSMEFMENIFRTTADGIIVTDTNGSIVQANRAVEQMLGYGENELIGKHNKYLGIRNKQDLETAQFIADELKEKYFVKNCEAQWRKKNGETIYVELNISALKDSDGAIVGDVSVIRDVSERRKMQEQMLQSAKLKSLGELASGVAHDFNNILAAILGRSQLLQQQTTKLQGAASNVVGDFVKGLEVIEKAARDGSETVRRIQNFSKSKTNSYQETVDLAEIIHLAIDYTKVRWKSEAESKNINIDLKRNIEPDLFVAGNSSELREVMVNMINNAVDALPAGGTITVTAGKKDDTVTISIQDTGTGIGDDIKDVIFDPFFTTKGPKSPGLGLSMTYGIIKRHHGSITFESTVGQGTQFFLSLPGAAYRVKCKPVSTESASPQNLDILVIDDEEAVREIVKDILKEFGHRVTVAANGKEGIDACSEKHFDLVLTDLGMPGISGVSVASIIKKHKPQLPVMLLTGWDVDKEDDELLKSGIDIVLHKPIQIRELAAAIEEGAKIGAALKKGRSR